MSEVDISPLAKRLAEENNVDWRKLRGSGADGKVVERDVLEFLARVMAGEEDVDPTPEPLPAGMEEWPEEDIASYRRGARERAGAAGGAEAPAQPETEEIDEGIFLFDDEDEAPATAEPEEEPDVFAVAGGDEIEEDEDLFLDLEDEEEEAEEPSGGRAFDVSVDFDADSAPKPMRGAVDLGDMGFDMDEPDAPEQGGAAVADAERDLDFVGSGVVEEAPAVPSAGQEGPPLMRRGTLLRRHIDVTALKSAQAVLAQELGHDEPLPIAAFLLRAAAKAHRQHRLGEGGIVLATIEGGLAFADVGDPMEGAFRDLVSALAAVTPSPDAPEHGALAVVDLSELEIDEAVLDAPLPVLAFGRVLYDDQGGDVRGTLSLSGDVRPDVGGRLLAAAADLLSAPVRLLV